METKDPRAQKWPPPTPKTMLQQVREEEAKRSAEAAQGRTSWFGRSRKSKRTNGGSA
jgi:hypothetical protein